MPITSTPNPPSLFPAMAANPLAVNLALSAGIPISWGTWALAGIVPGLVALVSVPLILYALYPPEVKDTPDAPAAAQKELDKLGPLSLNEKITAGENGAEVWESRRVEVSGLSVMVRQLDQRDSSYLHSPTPI